MKPGRRILFLFLFMLCLTACGAMLSEAGPVFSLPRLATQPAERGPQLRIATVTPTPEPSPTPQPIKLIATVWQSPPKAPILMYHRFNTQSGGNSYAYTTSLTDFAGHIEALYEAGYSLVALEDWLQGKIEVPAGRRPLIITMDDLYYADQLSLDAQGQPAPYSGIGLLWQFYQDHPDFQFHISLFYNMGDKQYANTYENGVFYASEGWQQSRAESIAWGIRNGAMPSNHFYNHPFLDQLGPSEIQWQLAENDNALRSALALVGKEKLAEHLPNILALPYSVWPTTDAGKQVLYDYISPEGLPVAAILEADEATNARLISAPFSQDFDRWHVPRINARWYAIEVILSLQDEIPIAETCRLGKFDPDHISRPESIMQAIQDRTADGRCPMGYYIVNDFIFSIDSNAVIQFLP